MVRATAITPEPIASYPRISWDMTRAGAEARSAKKMPRLGPAPGG